MSYRPLPDFLTVKNSMIDGLGLFATQSIEPNIYLGMTHIFNDNFEDNYIRTPLAGFYNHSDNPNILSITTDKLLDIKAGTVLSNDEIKLLQTINANKYKYLITIKYINRGDELCSKYNLYTPTR